MAKRALQNQLRCGLQAMARHTFEGEIVASDVDLIVSRSP